MCARKDRKKSLEYEAVKLNPPATLQDVSHTPSDDDEIQKVSLRDFLSKTIISHTNTYTVFLIFFFFKVQAVSLRIRCTF